MANMPAVRIVVPDPETQNAVTHSFNSMQEAAEWLTAQLAEKKAA